MTNDADDLHQGASDPLSLFGPRSLLLALRTPDSGLVGQVVRFLAAGGIVASVYLGVTTILATVVGMPFQAALAIGFGVALTVHFTLQRMFVWIHHEEFALSLRHQATRYLMAAALQYGVTVASTSLLPPVVGLSAEVIYLITVPVVMGCNFLIFSRGIFHAADAPHPPPAAAARPRD